MSICIHGGDASSAAKDAAGLRVVCYAKSEPRFVTLEHEDGPVSVSFFLSPERARDIGERLIAAAAEAAVATTTGEVAP
jgi:hypothetical protein